MGRSTKSIEPFELLASGLGLLGPLFDLIEAPTLRKLGDRPAEHPPVFVVGAPRTGSTIFNQWLTNRFQVACFDNVVALFFRNPVIGMNLSRRLYGNKPHNSFRSRHGRTYPFALHGPSEFGRFWYRWIPKDALTLDSGELPETSIAAIRRLFCTMGNQVAQPIISTNNNMGMRLGLVRDIDPGSRVIWVRRDPVFVAQSILRTRLDRFGDYNAWWSIRPPDYTRVRELPVPEQVVHQIHGIETRIAHDLDRYLSGNHVTVRYETLCEDQDALARSLRPFLGNAPERKGAKPLSVHLSRTWQLSDEWRERIQTEVAKLEWPEDSSPLHRSAESQNSGGL